MHSLNNITIDHLRVSASKDEVKKVAFIFENQLLLEQYDHRKWVFVRKLTVNGNKYELNKKASYLLKQNLQQALHGATSEAINANVVYFNHLPELLVFLLQDVIDNTLLRKWYWSAWHKFGFLSKFEQVYTVLSENIEQLPSIVELLIDKKIIRPVWQQLNHSSANQLLLSLGQRQPLIFRHAASAQKITNSIAEFVVSFMPNAHVSGELIQAIYAALTVWQSVVNGLSKNDNRVKLACDLIIRMYIPVLNRQQYDQIKLLIIDALVRTATIAVKSSTTEQEKTHHYSQDDNQSTTQEKIHCLTSLLSDPPFDHHEPTYDQKMVAPSIEKNAEKNIGKSNNYVEIVKENVLTTNDNGSVEADFFENNEVNDFSIANDVDENAIELVIEPCFCTQWGGFFYLINLLNMPKLQALLMNDELTPSAWLWLFDLSRRLSCPLDQSLQQFIAERAGIESVEVLVEWPPIVELAEVYEWLSKYESIINNPTAWLGVNAKVFANKSHIDCYFSIDDVQLDVRMMGLDVNPGWVPWLGRIVTFYYE